MSTWKQDFANQAEQALEHPIVQGVLDESRLNLRIERETLEDYQILKIASYVAQVARAQALGIDPDDLRRNDAERDEYVESLIAAAAKAQKPLIAVEVTD